MEQLQQHLESLLDEIKEYKSLNSQYTNLISLVKNYKKLSGENLNTIAEMAETIQDGNNSLETKIKNWKKLIADNHQKQEVILDDFQTKSDKVIQDYEEKIKGLDQKIEKIITKKFMETDRSIKESNNQFQKSIIKGFKIVIGLIVLFGILSHIF